MGWIRYWWSVLRRAGQETWEMVIPHSWKSLFRDSVIFVVAACLLYYLQGDLVNRHLTSDDNLQDTVVWVVFVAIAVVALFAFLFVIEALLVVPYQMWRELDSQIGQGTESSSDLMGKLQSGEWEIALPPRNDGPNWPLRDLFCYIEPSLRERNDPLVARDVGLDVLDKFSTQQLSAWGRPDSGGTRRPLIYIPPHFWSSGAEFIYQFLDGEEDVDPRDLVHPAIQPVGVSGGESGYRDIQVNRREATRIWRKKTEENVDSDN